MVKEWEKQKGLEIPESEYLMPLVESYYTVEEAGFLTGFPLGWKTLEQIAEIKCRLVHHQ